MSHYFEIAWTDFSWFPRWMTSNASYQLENMQKLEIFASFPGNTRIKHSWITFIQAKSGVSINMKWWNVIWNGILWLFFWFSFKTLERIYYLRKDKTRNILRLQNYRYFISLRKCFHNGRSSFNGLLHKLRLKFTKISNFKFTKIIKPGLLYILWTFKFKETILGSTTWIACYEVLK